MSLAFVFRIPSLTSSSVIWSACLSLGTSLEGSLWLPCLLCSTHNSCLWLSGNIMFSSSVLFFCPLILRIHHWYSGRNVGMQAATIPICTSNSRHNQFTMPSYVSSRGIAWLLRIVRTRQQAPVMNPKHINSNSPTFVLKSICTRHRNRIGSAAKEKSETTDIIAWARTIASFALRLIHVPLPSHAACIGWHCIIHMTLRIVFENKRKATAHCNGLKSVSLFGMRIKNKQIETFVHMSVEKVWIHSPYVYFLNCWT